jgi:hypothetical protein
MLEYAFCGAHSSESPLVLKRFPAQRRAGIRTRMAPRRGAVDPRSHLLGASRALVSLSIPTACALGRAVHSPALAGRPPWPSGEFETLLTCQPHQLHARGPVDDRSTSPVPAGPMQSARASTPQVSGTTSTTREQVYRPPMAERRLVQEPLTSASHTVPEEVATRA